MKPTIFITNDDGINSPGIKAMAEAVSELGEVIVFAPKNQQTGMGRSLVGRKEEHFEEIEFEIYGKPVQAYQIDCSPALTVEHALSIFFINKKPDILLSGINYGENLGANVTQSGTVGAALEGACSGIPSLAVSFETEIENHSKYGNLDWTAPKHFAKIFTEKVLARKLLPDVHMLKIDIPSNANINTGWELTKLSRQPYYTVTYENLNRYSKIGDAIVQVDRNNSTIEKGTDVDTVLNKRKVSITPISFDLTSRIDFDVLNKHFMEK